jgi:hypothetical protein
MVFIYPFMAGIQEISGRLGRITGRGIAGNIHRFYQRWALYSIVALLLLTDGSIWGAFPHNRLFLAETAAALSRQGGDIQLPTPALRHPLLCLAGETGRPELV